MRIIIASITMLICFTNSVAAQDERKTFSAYVMGQDLTEQCRTYLRLRRAGGNTSDPKEAYESGSCYAYVTAIVEGLKAEGQASV